MSSRWQAGAYFCDHSHSMFGLPPETLYLLLGAPLAWIVYTIVFLVRTRRWVRDAEEPAQD